MRKRQLRKIRSRSLDFVRFDESPKGKIRYRSQTYAAARSCARRRARGQEHEMNDSDPAWACPDCLTGIELGEESWEHFGNAASPALCFDCGAELIPYPDEGLDDHGDHPGRPEPARVAEVD